MQRRFIVLDGDGEPIRAFLTKPDAEEYIEKRPGFTLYVQPKTPKEKPTETPFEKALREVGDALL